jgi:hypothetical protein
MERRRREMLSLCILVGSSQLFLYNAGLAASVSGAINTTCNINDNKSTVESCNSAILEDERELSYMPNRKSAKDGAMEDRTYRIMLEGEIGSYLKTQRLLEARRSQHTELENYVWPSTRRGLPPATYTSANWSGVVEVGNFGTSSSFDNMFSVSGQFAVPGVDVPGGATCPNTGTVYIAAQWVGLGGAQPQLATPGDQVLYQAGVDEEWDCSKGTSGKRTYYVWWEDFHADNNGGSAQYMQRLNGYGVTAGDVMSMLRTI